MCSITESKSNFKTESPELIGYTTKLSKRSTLETFAPQGRVKVFDLRGCDSERRCKMLETTQPTHVAVSAAGGSASAPASAGSHGTHAT